MRGLRGKSEVKNNKGKAPKNANIEEQAKEGALAKKTTKTQNKSQKGRSKTSNIRHCREGKNSATKWKKQPTI